MATGRKLWHYFATERWKDGWGIEMISRALGHRNLDVTRRLQMSTTFLHC